MKYTLITTLTLALTLPAFAMQNANNKTVKQQLSRIRSLITETMACVKTSSFPRTQKQTLNSQLSTVGKQHDTLTKSIDEQEQRRALPTMSNEELAATLKELQQLALSKHQANLCLIEEIEQENAKFCFFEQDPLLQLAKKVVTSAVKRREQISSDYPY